MVNYTLFWLNHFINNLLAYEKKIGEQKLDMF